jgi:predicted dehydrogenase
LASHTLDLLDFLIGPIQGVSGHASNQSKLYEAEDMVSGSYVFQSGAQGTGVWCFSAYTDMDRNEIIGTKGKISFSTFDHVPIQLTTNKGIEEWEIEQPQHVQQPLIQAVVNELLGRGKSPSFGESGARTNRVMEKLAANYNKR